MINFEEEIRKYRPSLEIDQAEDAIYNTDTTDMVDVMLRLSQDSAGGQGTGAAQPQSQTAGSTTRRTQNRQ